MFDSDWLKEKVEFWEEVTNNLWALSLYYASVEEHQIQMFPEKHGSSNALIF